MTIRMPVEDAVSSYGAQERPLWMNRCHHTYHESPTTLRTPQSSSSREVPGAQKVMEERRQQLTGISVKRGLWSHGTGNHTSITIPL
ncbi:hypothetical protein FKM82_009397 [Ascaphus truei]